MIPCIFQNPSAIGIRQSAFRGFSPLDIHFANLMLKYADASDHRLFLASALVSKSTRNGHICMDLANGIRNGDESNDDCADVQDVSGWRHLLRRFPVVGFPGDFKPLILDAAGRLYLFRYWEYERKLAEGILDRIHGAPGIHPSGLNFNGFFRSHQNPDWQKVAAVAAITRNFCAISGSPGTGKTTTAARILSLFLTETDRSEIVLAAPTGKAAARLREAICQEKEVFHPQVLDRIPQETYTIHRLLGSSSYPPYFRYHEKNRLSADLVIIDEASMADLPMMSRLVQALPKTARLILMGDMDQLASVNPGAVFSDICAAADISGYSEAFRSEYFQLTGETIPCASAAVSPMSDSLVKLRTNYRFGSGSGIHEVSQAVNRGDAGEIFDKLTSGAYDDMIWKNLPEPNRLQEEIREWVLDGFTPYLTAAGTEDIFEEFRRFRILCAHRIGTYGISSLNAVVERILREKNLIFPQRRFYRGRPVLITQNEYHLKLFNGDLGIVLDDSNGNPMVFFKSADGNIRVIPPGRLPEHETAYAMTVHKSQGSEFDRILLMLPDRESPILTRELIYTGITRAKKKAIICGNKEVFFKAVSEKIQRTSGLRDALKTLIVCR